MARDEQQPATFLRPLDPARDGPSLHALYSDEECCRYLTRPATATVAETIALLTEYMCGPPGGCWAVVEGDPEGPALGRVAMIPRGEGVFEAACMTVPAAQGRGLTRAALAKALDFAFLESGARRVYADIDPDNAASIRLFERLGFQHEGRLRAAWATHIGVRDTIMMAVIDSDIAVGAPWRR